jgi:hypothetical protein
MREEGREGEKKGGKKKGGNQKTTVSENFRKSPNKKYFPVLEYLQEKTKPKKTY